MYAAEAVDEPSACPRQAVGDEAGRGDVRAAGGCPGLRDEHRRGRKAVGREQVGIHRGAQVFHDLGAVGVEQPAHEDRLGAGARECRQRRRRLARRHTLAAGLGFSSPIWVGAALTAAGLGVLVVADRLACRGNTRGVPGLQPA